MVLVLITQIEHLENDGYRARFYEVVRVRFGLGDVGKGLEPHVEQLYGPVVVEVAAHHVIEHVNALVRDFG